MRPSSRCAFSGSTEPAASGSSIEPAEGHKKRFRLKPPRMELGDIFRRKGGEAATYYERASRVERHRAPLRYAHKDQAK
jgi:hypothetical protein